MIHFIASFLGGFTGALAGLAAAMMFLGRHERKNK